MQKQIYPDYFIENSVESHISKHSKKTNIIYITVLLSFVIIICILPLIKVDISIQSDGIVRPVSEKNEVKSIVSGIISSIKISENQKVYVGQTILSLHTDLNEKIKILETQTDEKEQILYDLNLIINLKPNFKGSMLKTALYRQKYIQYKNEINNIDNKIKKSESDLKRSDNLYKKNHISKSEFEAKTYNYSSLQAEKQLTKEMFLSNLQSDLLSYKLDIQQLTATLSELKNTIQFYTIKSPVSGTIEQFSGLSRGTFIQAGQTLAVISPDTLLIIEMYVKPKDIGFLKVGTLTDIQVDAFNYNYWGFIPSKITEISDDFFIIDRKPFFRVRCSLTRDYLSLKSGLKGYLKKGMTVRGRFFITKRSLFHLLYDDVNNWLNPKNSLNKDIVIN